MSNMNQKKDGKIRDVDIRLEFMKRNLKFFERKGVEFVNEFGINSTNIVDLAAFDFTNKIFYGFEIKSELDNTKRLYNQLNAYISFFQIVYVITHEKHLEEIEEILDTNKQFGKVGLIKVDQDLHFTELRRARPYTPFYTLFIQNLDLEEIRLLAAKHNLPLTGSKKVLLSRLRRYVTLDQIYEGIEDKVRKYYAWKCPACGSNIYYNKSGRDGLTHVCYKCGYRTYI